jgi:hypothetical protein
MTQKPLELIQLDAILQLTSGKAMAQSLRRDFATQPCPRGITLGNLPETLPSQPLTTPVKK